MMRIGLFVAASLLCFHHSARAQSEEDTLTQLFLGGLRDISISINFSAREGCEYPAQQARADIVNRIVPAGFIINSQDINIIDVTFTSIRVGDHSCAANIDVHFIGYSIASVPQAIVPVLVWQAGGVISGPRGGFLGQSQEALGRYIDRFLGRWREVNAGADFVRPAPSTAPVPRSRTAAPDQNAPLQTGPDTRTVQRRLQELGLYVGGIDGIAGPGTRQAVQAFQRSRQLPATGDLDNQTMRQLFP